MRLQQLRRAAPITGFVVLAACRTAAVRSESASVDTANIRRDIAHLASDALEGRGTGTVGNDSAAAYLARRYEALKLEPAVRRECAARSACRASFLMPFTAQSVAAAHAGVPGGLTTQNVVAVLRGSDPALRDEYIVVGAHYDHLGRSAFGALDPHVKDSIRNGADDNASGTAAVLELARLLSKRPPKRSIIFAHFSGEELGLLGSQYFVQHPPVATDRMVAMLNFDMIGRLRNERLIVYGVATAAELPEIVERANVAPQLDIRALGDGYGPSDHSSFYAKGIPVLHFFTDLHEDYHRATDDAGKINVAGEARVIELAERIVRDIADRPSRLTAVLAPQVASAPRRDSASAGYGAYLGSIPDMGAAGVKGVRLTGVRPGSPAEKGGLKAGDVIVEFGGKPVRDLYEYTDALRAHKAGDVVTIVIERGGQRLTLTATLGTRGG